MELGHRRQELVATAGSRWRQEWSDAVGPGLGGGGIPAVRSKGGRSRVPAAVYYSAREEGIGGAGTLEKCGAGRCLRHVTGVSSMNINIGKFYYRVTC